MHIGLTGRVGLYQPIGFSSETLSLNKYLPIAAWNTRPVFFLGSGRNGELTYGLTEMSDSDYFDVETTSGAVTVKRGLGDIEGRTVAFEVFAADRASSSFQQSASAMLHVTVVRQ